MTVEPARRRRRAARRARATADEGRTARAPSLRSLVRLACALFILEQLLYAALTPLLPYYAHELALSKSATGLLAGIYTAGLVPGSLLGGAWSRRLGPRRTTLVGLVLLAGASVGFGLARSLVALDVLRSAQGVASGLIWCGALTWVIGAAPRRRRGKLLGTTLAGAVVGTLLGPALGTVAVLVGPTIAFTAVAAAACGLAVAVLRTPPPTGSVRRDGVALRQALRHRPLLAGAWATTLLGLGNGLVNAIVPLRLTDLGASEVAVGATFLAACGATILVAPVVGRATDRRGPIALLRASSPIVAPAFVALPLARPALLAAALTVVVVAIAVGAMAAPAFTLLTGAAEDAGLALATATAILNLAWALGETVGAAAGASAAEATANVVPFVVLGALILVTAAGLSSRGVSAAAASRRHRV